MISKKYSRSNLFFKTVLVLTFIALLFNTPNVKGMTIVIEPEHAQQFPGFYYSIPSDSNITFHVPLQAGQYGPRWYRIFNKSNNNYVDIGDIVQDATSGYPNGDTFEVQISGQAIGLLGVWDGANNLRKIYLKSNWYQSLIRDSRIIGNWGVGGDDNKTYADRISDISILTGSLLGNVESGSSIGSILTRAIGDPNSTPIKIHAVSNSDPYYGVAIVNVQAYRGINANIEVKDGNNNLSGNIMTVQSGLNPGGYNSDIKGSISSQNVTNGIFCNYGSLKATINVSGTIGAIMATTDIGTTSTPVNITSGIISNLKIGGSIYANFNVGTLCIGSADTDILDKLAGGTSTITNLYIANISGKTGALDLEGGTLTVRGNISDGPGTSSLYLDGGTLNMSGSGAGIGLITVDNFTVGYHSGKTGSYTLTGSKQITVTNSVVIGFSGTGTFNLGGSGSTGFLTQNQNGTPVNLTVCENVGAAGTFIGRGSVGLKGVLKNNGVVKADGFNMNNDLDLSNFTSMDNSTDNPTTNGTNGWFAVRKGRLKLPKIPVNNGTSSYNWGEASTDTAIDLVNSLCLSFTGVTGVTGSGSDGLSISLLALDRSEFGVAGAQKLPAGWKPVGIWEFVSPAWTFTNCDLIFRYDDAKATAQGINIANLAVL